MAIREEKLLQQWSPEQISAHADISPETVYQGVYADKRKGGGCGRACVVGSSARNAMGRADRRGMIPQPPLHRRSPGHG